MKSPMLLLSCCAMLTFLCACSASAQRPDQVESVLDVINRAQATDSSGALGCPGGTIPVCVSAFRHDKPACSCGSMSEIQRANEYSR